MSETNHINQTPSDNPNSPFKALVSEEKLPLRIRDEVVGTMEIITLFGNIVQLFTTNFGNAVISMLADSTQSPDDDNFSTALAAKSPIPLNDNTSSLT